VVQLVSGRPEIAFTASKRSWSSPDQIFSSCSGLCACAEKLLGIPTLAAGIDPRNGEIRVAIHSTATDLTRDDQSSSPKITLLAIL
jgi:hypothetical protein